MLRVLALLLAFVAVTQGFARASEAAPADEYFGPFHQSILEIRNRLIRFEGEADRELAGHARGIDSLEVTIEDWYRHYPRDPWIPGFMHRTIRLYARIGASGAYRARHAGRILAALRR